MSRQLDVVHFIQNAIMLESLSKLSLSKADRFLIRRQPKVHLLSYDSEHSSNNSDKETDDEQPCYGEKMVKLYFGSKKNEAQIVQQPQQQNSTTLTNTQLDNDKSHSNLQDFNDYSSA